MKRSVYVSLCSFLVFVGLTGQSMGAPHGFLYSGGTFTTLDVPGSLLTQAFGINDSGEIVGRFVDGTVVPEPATWLLLGSGILGLMYFRKRLAAA